MKRSNNVVLTLLVPAIAAFGCGSQPSSVAYRNHSEQSAQECDIPAKPGEPEKPKCPPKTQQQSSSSRSSHYRSSSYRPWFGGSTSSTHSPSSGSHSTTHISTGGFGHTGSHYSGGS